MSHRRVTRLAVGLALIAGLTVGFQQPADATLYSSYALMSGLNVVPASGSLATGTVVVEVDTTNSVVCATVNLNDLSGPVTGAHLHKAPAGAGSATPTATFVLDDVANGSQESCVVVPAMTVTELATSPSNFFVDIHTTAYPGGEIRGQLGRQSPPRLTAVLSGLSAVPPNASPATGGVTLHIDPTTNRVCADYSYANLTSFPIAVFVHEAPVGVQGPLVVMFPTPDNSVVGASADCVTDTDAPAILANPTGYYFSIHTTSFPGTEIRGQLRAGSGARVSLPGTVASSTNWGLATGFTGPASNTFAFGTRPNVPLTGDWNGDGSKTAGSYEAGVFKLRNTNAAGAPDQTFNFGDPRGFPVSGDFDGDGTDDVAVFKGGVWQVRLARIGAPTIASFSFGGGVWPSVVPVAGDWNGDGIDGIGYYCLNATVCPAGTWNLRNTATAGMPDIAPFVYAPGFAAYPVVGDWDGDGDDTVGVKSGQAPGLWQLNNANDNSAPEQSFNLGVGNDLPVTWTQRVADLSVRDHGAVFANATDIVFVVRVINHGPDAASAALSASGTYSVSSPGTPITITRIGGSAPVSETCSASQPGPMVFSWNCLPLTLPAYSDARFTIKIDGVAPGTTVSETVFVTDAGATDPDPSTNSNFTSYVEP